MARRPSGPWEDGVEAGHDRQKRLCGADVRGRLLPPDMLLAGLQAQPVGPVAVAVDRHADQPSGHGAGMGGLGRHVGRVRPAIAQRNAEPLGGTDGDVGPHRPRLFQEAERQRIGSDDPHGLGVVQRGDGIGEIPQMPVGPGILEDRAEDSLGLQRLRRAHDHLDPERRGPRLDHSDGLRMTVLIDEERLGLRLCHALRHGHSLGRRRRLVEKRGVGDLEPGQVAHHGLEVQQCLEPALADLRLIGRIGRVPRRVLQYVPLDRRRRDRPVIALPDERGQNPVLPCRLAHEVKKLPLRLRFSEIERGLLPDRPSAPSPRSEPRDRRPPPPSAFLPSPRETARYGGGWRNRRAGSRSVRRSRQLLDRIGGTGAGRPAATSGAAPGARPPFHLSPNTPAGGVRRKPDQSPMNSL